MSSSAKAEALLALHRFGMGPRPGSVAAIEADPRGALIADRPSRIEKVPKTPGPLFRRASGIWVPFTSVALQHGRARGTLLNNAPLDTGPQTRRDRRGPTGELTIPQYYVQGQPFVNLLPRPDDGIPHRRKPGRIAFQST